MTAQADRIVLQQPPAATTAPGHCRWCGRELTDPAAAIAHARAYCDEREGRDCRTAYRRSYASNPREALIRQARDAGEPLRCTDCGAELATFSGRGICVGIRQWDADYRTPLVHGGRHTLENLTARCRAGHEPSPTLQAQEAAHAR